MKYLGIVLLLVLPLFAGTVFNIIFRKKETSQSETYLIGFFSLFLLQGVMFSQVTLFGKDYDRVAFIYTAITYVIVVAGIIGIVYKTVKKKRDKLDSRPIMSKDDWIMLSTMVVFLVLIIYRLVLLYDFIREDMMLETVRINVLTGTINQYNPLNGHPYELGLITSKKIITLPTYYTYWCMQYGINERLLLYIIVSLQTILCVYYVCYQNARMMVNTKKKQFTILTFLGVLILAGDYFQGAIGYKILWNGYAGESIIAAVGLLYLIYLGIDHYKSEESEPVENRWHERIVRIVKFIIVLAGSVFMTSIYYGAVLYAICIIVMVVCWTIRGGKEVDE